MKFLRWIPLGLLLLPISAHAITFTLNTTSGGYNYKATADFSVVSGRLQVVLTNTQASGAPSNANVFTGVFFSIPGLLSGGTAAMTAGSTLVGTNPFGSDTVAQHWAYKNGTPSPSFFSGVTQGIGTAGFGFYGPGDAFQGGGQNPVLDGVDFGMVGNAVNGASTQPFVFNSMTFTFDLPTPGFQANSTTIRNVWFQYGSDFSEFQGFDPEFPPGGDPVPEPAAMAMVAFTAAAVWARRKK